MKFNFHGLGVAVSSPSKKLLYELAHDFSYFRVESLIHTSFRVRHRPWKERPQGKPGFSISKRSKMFFAPAGERHICFFGAAFVVYRFKKGMAEIYFDDVVIGYETIYLVMMAFIGEKLAEHGLHRIHGLGIDFNGSGVVALGRSGIGKSTIALEMLKRKKGKLLSDDIPWVGSGGMVKAFPNRIATKTRPDVPKAFVRKFKRSQYGEKFVVGADYFKDRIAVESNVKHLILLRRKKRVAAEGINSIRRWKMVLPLFRWLIVGHETPQIWELFLPVDLSEVPRKIKIAVGRIRVALRLLSTAQTWELWMPRHPRQTAKALECLGRVCE